MIEYNHCQCDKWGCDRNPEDVAMGAELARRLDLLRKDDNVPSTACKGLRDELYSAHEGIPDATYFHKSAVHKYWLLTLLREVLRLTTRAIIREQAAA